jgi:hypothetical protein
MSRVCHFDTLNAFCGSCLRCSPSAASQAITTYIRTHARRCEDEQDAPLLVKHTLSGTLADDDLAPALYSLAGGAQATVAPSGNRRTNFRKGTTVWYLSRTAGASCPFARAGIRVCDYTEDGKRGENIAAPARERRRDRDHTGRITQCGEKRKRLTRSCVDKAEDEESSADEKRAPKVKIMLRLKPTVAILSNGACPVPRSPTLNASRAPLSGASSSPDSSEDDSLAADSSSENDDDEAALPMASVDALQSVFPAPFESAHDLNLGIHRRLPSMPFSAMSLPPDSEDEEERHVGITGRRRSISADLSFSDFDETDEDVGWFDDQDDSADEADDEAKSRTGPLSLSPTEHVSPSLDAVARHLDKWEAMDNRVGELASTPIEPRTAMPWVKHEDLNTSWTWGRHEVSSPSSFWGEVDDSSAFDIKQEPEDMFSSLELPPDIPLDLEDVPGSAASCGPLPISKMRTANRQRRNSTWHTAELVNTDELHVADFDDLPKLSLSLSSVKSPMATAVPSPTHVTPPASLSILTCSWKDSVPSLSSSLSSSVAGSSYNSFGVSSGSDSIGEPMSSLVSRPPMPKQFSQSTIRTTRIEPQTPWEYGLVSPADVDADFQTYFSMDELKFSPENLSVPDLMESDLEVFHEAHMSSDPAELDAMSEFLSIPTMRGLELDFDMLNTGSLDQFTVDPEIYATLALGDDASAEGLASHDAMDVERPCASLIVAAAPEPITSTPALSQPEVDSKLRRSTRLASQSIPKTPTTTKGPRHRSRAQSSR